MKLQISFDKPDLGYALPIAKQVAPFCDIIEVNTIFLYKYGLEALKAFREAVGQNILLADSKIIDRGNDTATLFSTGNLTDWITVMAGTSNDVIHATCSTAHDKHKKVMLDLLDSSSPEQAVLEAQSLGVDALMFHKPHDASNSLAFLENWDLIRGNTKLPIFISARIDRDNIERVLKIKPDGIIIGPAIVEAQDPLLEAQYFYQLCQGQ